MDNGSEQKGMTYWRSLRELHNAGSVSEAKANEFMAGVTDDFRVEQLPTMSRQQFLALLSASAAFAAAGCSNYRDRGAIVPYTKKPEEVTPGLANTYASTCAGCAQACGILIKTREGRPIKVDGNPDHPINRGKVCATGQASILNLYDPSRLRAPQFGGRSGRTGRVTWASADAEIAAGLKKASDAGTPIALVSRTLTSPTAKKAVDAFIAAYPSTRLYSYDVRDTGARRSAWKASYGAGEPPVIRWENADLIVTLEADILGTEGSTIETIRRFTQRRDVMASSKFNRLYAIEGTMSLTGANADRRLRLRPDQQLRFVYGLMNALAERGAISAPPAAAGISLEELAKECGWKSGAADSLVSDLVSSRGTAVVYAGDILPASVHVAVNLLNELLGNTSLYESAASVVHADPSTPVEIVGLVDQMKRGRVAAVVHVDVNPAFDLPKSLGYTAALAAVPLSVALAESDDETSELCHYVLPVHHAFESWGDAQVRTGVLSLQQPVISPLYDSRQKEAILLAWADPKTGYNDKIYHEFLMARWENEVYPAKKRPVDFRSFWFASLHDGVAEIPQTPPARGAFRRDALASAGPAAAGFTVAVTTPSYVGDGRFAGNGWLQELPHPVSKVVWDNYAAISESTARELGVGNDDLVEVTLSQGAVTLPVFVQPGQADKMISVDLGYGRWHAGPVGSGVGFSVGALLDPKAPVASRVFSGAAVRKVDGTYQLASTQEHHALDDPATKELHLKRGIIREGTVDEYENDHHFLHEDKHTLFNIAPSVEFSGLKWAMAIDMNKCIGCNACVAGCNVENNIPVVGKDQVARGREMQWIRIDRYYAGTADDPSLSHQPMLCQHCDNAPCENVCPVAATNHSPDGLNQMVYNRCVGTKYCSNNCPYKVRRFNFYDFRDNFADGYYEADVVSLAQNPEVTVRSRGVMEKCTFCIQRIAESRQHAIEQGRTVRGSDVKTACQEACPATAIVFGDMNDPNSEVSRYRAHALGYSVLEELNVRPNVTYIARLRNTTKEGNA